ncbi:hypothetical protein SAMD00019534_097570, partial [Acytostelium subglobosum LB1]|uniref:hypothetical protein n=1 Tax=Acytostelium subglobosum LB1 TaxID=1410327 RepID=UPI0006450AEF
MLMPTLPSLPSRLTQSLPTLPASWSQSHTPPRLLPEPTSLSRFRLSMDTSTSESSETCTSTSPCTPSRRTRLLSPQLPTSKRCVCSNSPKRTGRDAFIGMHDRHANTIHPLFICY